MPDLFSAAVLAGGRSARFGRDKARFIYQGKPLLAHVLASLSAAAERFIVANEPYPEFGVPVVADLIRGGDSLSGLHSALSHARYDWIALAACDLPYLTPAYWVLLLQCRDLWPIVMVRGQQGVEPLAALYHKRLLPLVTEQLQRGDFAMRRLPELAGARFVDASEVLARCGAQVLTNANHPEELP